MTLKHDPLHHPYSSRRSVVYSQKGMVATSQPLAAQAGLEAIKQGGNAIDAAVAAAACLTVTEPTSNGIGGDAFALIWTNGRLHGLNASGPAPGLITAEKVIASGCSEMPNLGWPPVTVPGAPAAWAELSHKWGKLSLEEAFAPAIAYARDGFPVSPVTAEIWGKAVQKYKSAWEEGGTKTKKGRGIGGEEGFREWFNIFAPDGKAPRAGELCKLPDHASTLSVIAKEGAEVFYRGKIAEKIDAYSRNSGGFLRGEDLTGYEPVWVEPLSSDYRGCRIWELPPNGQGLVALLALNIFKELYSEKFDEEKLLHRRIESLKLAFAKGFRYITDPAKMKISPERLLEESYAQSMSKLIGDNAAFSEDVPGSGGGTVYLATADGEGNMVSFIQSNYEGFGSGLVVPGTGIALQNRGREFSLYPAHANYLEPGKKPYHTIIPGFLTENSLPLGPFGVMGGYMQPQGHFQLVTRMFDERLNPQAALDAPRWRWVEGNTIEVEHSFPLPLAHKLTARGHNVIYTHEPSGFGRGQVILQDPNSGIFCGATEPRADGTIAAW
ncbi:MAG: gamma-glutamyltransferase family protein [Bacillota bacterium]